MDIFNLPPELVQMIFDHFVLSRNPWRMVRLRLVDSRFRDLVDDSVFRLQYLRRFASSQNLTPYMFLCRIRPFTYVHRYLEYQVRREGRGPSLSPAGRVYRVAQALCLFDGKTGEETVSSCIKAIIPLATRLSGHDLLVNDHLECTREQLEADVLIAAAFLGRGTFVKRYTTAFTRAGVNLWTSYAAKSVIFGTLLAALGVGGHLDVIKLLYPSMDSARKYSVLFTALEEACANRNRTVFDWVSGELHENTRVAYMLWRIPWVDAYEQWKTKLGILYMRRHQEIIDMSTNSFKSSVTSGNLNMARYHLSHGLGGKLPQCHGSGWYALEKALHNRDEEMLQWLLEEGEDPNHLLLYNSDDPLSYAIKKDGSVRMIRLLLQHGARSKAGRPPPIVYAVLMEREDILRLLLEHGAQLDTPETGAWAMKAAKMNGLASMANFLSRRGLGEEEVYHHVPTRDEVFDHAWTDRRESRRNQG